ncbi:hypothetical protein M9H77_22593 [Catharanthus roseus]|uniref:Uncharacterized protein n=1 Tax=Catharanthus roseus TaxID=4058 RepID=A0ACC0ASF2_CATRO|nr:hypothetical protein M9H77_22593 [Catharanthus roseus]
MYGAHMLSRRSGRWQRGTICRGMVARGPTSTPLEKIGEAFAQSELYVKYQELKANEERLYIETGSPIPTDEQLTFEASSGSNKGHVYNFDSQSAAITVERRGGSSSTLSVPSAQDKFVGFMTSFATQYGVQLDPVPTTFPHFPLTDDPDILQPSTGPLSSSSPPPPM